MRHVSIDAAKVDIISDMDKCFAKFFLMIVFEAGFFEHYCCITRLSYKNLHEFLYDSRVMVEFSSNELSDINLNVLPLKHEKWRQILPPSLSSVYNLIVINGF